MKGIFQLINVVELLKLLVSNELRYKWKSYLLNTGSVMDTYLTNLSKFRGNWELAWRLRRYGAKLIYVPIKDTHLRKVTPISYLRPQFNRGIGIAGLYRI